MIKMSQVGIEFELSGSHVFDYQLLNVLAQIWHIINEVSMKLVDRISVKDPAGMKLRSEEGEKLIAAKPVTQPKKI